jgi:DNA invertase Pin-like site-specific DNA recombinase
MKPDIPQNEVATALGLPDSTISRWMNEMKITKHKRFVRRVDEDI